MLQSLHSAVIVKGRKNSAIARDIDRDPDTVTGWFAGRNPIPARIRNALDAAIGSPVDWPAYDAEFAALGRAKTARKAPPPPAAPAPRPAAPSPRPAEARRKPAEAPEAVGWGDTPPSAPTPAPAKRRAWLDDDPSFGGLL